MTQHRKVAADENIFVNTHNERRGGDGEKWGDNAAAGNMLSWRRLACREAAVGTEAYLMLFRSGAKHFPLLKKCVHQRHLYHSCVYDTAESCHYAGLNLGPGSRERDRAPSYPLDCREH